MCSNAMSGEHDGIELRGLLDTDGISAETTYMMRYLASKSTLFISVKFAMYIPIVGAYIINNVLCESSMWNRGLFRATESWTVIGVVIDDANWLGF